jgi:RNA 2',3'-cyclic 3'-phosphodiesterase
MPTRTFIAIELGDAARAALARTIAALARELPGVRFVEPASLHLTLAFLGDLDEAQLELATQATAAAAAAAQVSAPFALNVAGLGSFGPPHAPRVIWAGVGGNLRALTETQRALADELAARGFAREERPFAPHLTLARLKHPLDADAQRWLAQRLAAPAPTGAPIAARELSVMKSTPLPAGAVYSRLSAFSLGPSGGAAVE